MSNAADSLVTLGQQARDIEHAAGHPKARRLASQAVKCATGALVAHNAGQYDGANAHAEKAAAFLRDAATIHAGTLKVTGETPSPQILDAAHLGKGQELHSEYVHEINEGKQNGR